MLNSMTAFARTEKTFGWGRVVCELRAVNHRYLDMHFKLSESVKSVEPVIRGKIKGALQRGKMECFLHVDVNSAKQKISVNLPYLRALLDANAEVFTQMQVASEEKASTFLRWPGVLHSESTLPENCESLLLGLVDDAITQLLAHRQREGAELATFISVRLRHIEALIEGVRERMPEIISRQQEKIRDKIAQLDVVVDQDRLTQELVFLAQKADVAEELDRVSAHTKEVSIVMKKGEPCGRRLDFLMQELNREANTLGSKSINMFTSKASIDLKVFIEQMREQVQNIE